MKMKLNDDLEFMVYGPRMLLNPSNEISPFRYKNYGVVDLTDDFTLLKVSRFTFTYGLMIDATNHGFEIIILFLFLF